MVLTEGHSQFKTNSFLYVILLFFLHNVLLMNKNHEQKKQERYTFYRKENS